MTSCPLPISQLVKFVPFCIIPELEHSLRKFRFCFYRRKINSSLLQPHDILFSVGAVRHFGFFFVAEW
jgi:hypothetical protein